MNHTSRKVSLFGFGFAISFLLAATNELPAQNATEGKVVLRDDFNRNETDEAKEEIGNGWSTNSKSRAKGNKQADLRDGTLHIKTHAEADHAASVRHAAEFEDANVTLRFKLEHAKDQLGLNFADPEYKKVHAGHLFRVAVNTKSLTIEDLKTGKMDLALRTARIAKKPVPKATQEMLKTKVWKTPIELEVDHWYAIRVNIQGQTVKVWIDGKQIGEFASEGISHKTKRLLRLAIPREVVVDDLQVVAL